MSTILRHNHTDPSQCRQCCLPPSQDAPFFFILRTGTLIIMDVVHTVFEEGEIDIRYQTMKRSNHREFKIRDRNPRSKSEIEIRDRNTSIL